MAAERLRDVLETYRGRDKVMRLLGYGSLLVSSAFNKPSNKHISEKLIKFGEAMSDCRVILRLFDDIPMFCVTKEFGRGEKRDKILRFIEILENFIDQAYYPIEHICWLKDLRIISGSSSWWWDLGDVVWLCSLVIGILRCLRLLAVLHKEEKRCKQLLQCSQDADDQSSLAGDNERYSVLGDSISYAVPVKKQLRYIKLQKYYTVMSIIHQCADLGNAVNWLPQGILWSGKLPAGVVGLLGTIASSLMLIQFVNPLTPPSDKEKPE